MSDVLLLGMDDLNSTHQLHQFFYLAAKLIVD